MAVNLSCRWVRFTIDDIFMDRFCQIDSGDGVLYSYLNPVYIPVSLGCLQWQ